MSQIEFAFFDLGNVILEFSHELACQQVASVAQVSQDEVRRVLFDDGLQEQYETGLISTEELHRRFSEESKSHSSLSDFVFAGSDIFELNVEIAPIVTALGSAGLPLGILSNTCKAHWDYVLDMYRLVRDCFGVFVLSFEEHSMKPNPEIYQAAIQRSGVPADKIFFMDDRQENVAGAIEAGIDAVQFTSARQLSRELLNRGMSINL